MTIIETKEALPKNDTYVLAYFPNAPWISEGTELHKWKVVRFIKGLSLEDRTKLPNSDKRKRTYMPEDEQNNNRVPYMWQEFGPGSYYGQAASHWCNLPTVPTKETK
jgi:hypothetical protein